MEGLVSRSCSVKKFDFLSPFSKVSEKTEKNGFAVDQLYIEQCFASQIQMLTASCPDLDINPSIVY